MLSKDAGTSVREGIHCSARGPYNFQIARRVSVRHRKSRHRLPTPQNRTYSRMRVESECVFSSETGPGTNFTVYVSLRVSLGFVAVLYGMGTKSRGSHV